MKLEGQVTRILNSVLTVGSRDVPKSHIGNSMENLQMFFGWGNGG